MKVFYQNRTPTAEKIVLALILEFSKKHWNTKHIFFLNGVTLQHLCLLNLCIVIPNMNSSALEQTP